MISYQISLSKLIVGRAYIGRGRNGNIGLWDGSYFLVIGKKFDEYVIKHEPYYTEESGCFQPFLIIDEGENIKPIGNKGWDAHYSNSIEFRNIYKD